MEIPRHYTKGINFKLAVTFVALSLILTLVATGIRSYQRYQNEIDNINDQMEYIGKSYIPSITSSLWEVNREHIQIQLEGIVHLSYVQYVVVRSIDSLIVMSAGSSKAADAVTKHFDLSYAYKGQKLNLGSLEVVADLQSLRTRIWKDFYLTLFTEGLKIFLLTICIFFLIHLLVIRHLQTMAAYVRNINIQENFPLLTLNRRSTRTTEPDELDEVAAAINKTLANLKDSFEKLTQGNERLEREMKERLRTARSLKATFDRYQMILHTTQDGFWINDLSGKILEVNDSICRMLGYSREELVGMRIQDLEAMERPEETARHIQAIVENKGAFFESLHRRKDGSLVDVSVSIGYLPMDSGRVFAFIKDITDRKRAEKERQALQERLQRSEKMEAVGQLAGGVAHDLNNVLSVTMAYSELLKENIPQESPLKKSVDNIFASTQKAAAIIEDLLTLARRGVVVSKVMNLNSVVSGFLQTPVFDRIKGINVHVSFHVELGRDLLNIRGSAVHLEKVLMNLVSNSVEAISGAGVVTIRTENHYLDKPVHGYDSIREGDYAVLTVSDTGMGISAEHMGKIFEPFYTKKTMGKSGTGLGLSIVWGTVRDHQGYIDVQSEVGKGTAFTLYFPVTRKAVTDEAEKVPIEQYMGHGESVLVIDDVPEQRQVATVMLTRLGYQVNAVSSGEEALEYLKQNKTDILVLDMIMEPGMDGLETYQRIRQVNPDQRAIIVSGFSETQRVKKAQELGAGAYVRKPYIMEEVGLALRQELDRR